MSKEKCEWKDGHFVTCGSYQEMANIFKGIIVGDSISKKLKELGVNFCPICGADIRKPEPEVIIKESGQAWVGHCWDLDFIWFTSDRRPDFDMDEKHFSLLVKHGKWILFRNKDHETTLTLTDQIAKLRPLIIDDYDNTAILYGVDEDGFLVTGEGFKEPSAWRLATVPDLDESCQ